MIKIGREEPVASMDSSGKIIWAHHNEIQTVNVKSLGADTEDVRIQLLVPLTLHMLPDCAPKAPKGRLSQSSGKQPLGCICDLHTWVHWVHSQPPTFLQQPSHDLQQAMLEEEQQQGVQNFAMQCGASATLCHAVVVAAGCCPPAGLQQPHKHTAPSAACQEVAV